jgi:hypothetical protein
MSGEIRTSRRDLALWGAGLLLLAVALVRLAVPDRARLRSVSIEAMDIASEPIGQGQTVDREATWSPRLPLDQRRPTRRDARRLRPDLLRPGRRELKRL